MEYFTQAWKRKSMQCHLLEYAPVTIKELAQAIDDYLAVRNVDRPPKTMPAESAAKIHAEPPAWKTSLLAIVETIAKTAASPGKSKAFQTPKNSASNVVSLIYKKIAQRATSSQHKQ